MHFSSIEGLKDEQDLGVACTFAGISYITQSLLALMNIDSRLIAPPTTSSGSVLFLRLSKTCLHATTSSGIIQFTRPSSPSMIAMSVSRSNSAVGTTTGSLGRTTDFEKTLDKASKRKSFDSGSTRKSRDFSSVTLPEKKSFKEKVVCFFSSSRSSIRTRRRSLFSLKNEE